VRMDMRRIQTIKENGEAIGNRVRVKVIKNKVAPPFKQAEFSIIYGEGADKVDDLIGLAEKEGLITRRGAYYDLSHLGDKNVTTVQGKKKVVEILKENASLLEKIRDEIIARHFGEAEEE